MLLVKTKLGKSSIEGIGLFADQFIPVGTIVWEFTPELDIVISERELDRLPDLVRRYFLRYTYLNARDKRYILSLDDARFQNHSEHPNLVSLETPNQPEPIDVAARDIFPGEELTTNYKSFDHDFRRKLARPVVQE